MQNREHLKVDESFVKCANCKQVININIVNKERYSCPYCNKYLSIDSKKRIMQIVEIGTFSEWKINKKSCIDPINYKGYTEKQKKLQDELGIEDAITIGTAKIGNESVVIGAMDTRFMLGSMGQYVGEIITQAFERARDKRLPVILFCCSGGARMQEGIFSLMQMAKISAALNKFSKRGLLYISILTNPTMGGVTASFGMLGDLILAEPDAIIGFTGKRVIKETIHENLPVGFQTAEYQLKHGFIDAIVKREQQKECLLNLLRLHKRCKVKSNQIKFVRNKEKNIHTNVENKVLTEWEQVKIARSKFRPSSSVYINRLMKDFWEISGDRCWGNDGAIIGGIATFHNIPITVIGIERCKENIEKASRCNFGMPKPEGYRKALRLMKQAEKFARPIICFIDTPGAYPGIDAEERGQALMIARNLYEMSSIKVPIVSIIIGEGYSGGALGISVADEVWMLSNAVFSVASPEGCASILRKDNKSIEIIAKSMKLTAYDLLDLGIIDKVIDEDVSLSADNMKIVCEALENELDQFLKKYMNISTKTLINKRYKKYRKH